MANLDFYALRDDQRSLFEFLYSETDVVVYELSSQFDREARRFESLGALESAFTLGDYRAARLQFWSPSVMPRPVIRRIELKVPGHSFRYAVEGAGVVQLYLDGPTRNQRPFRRRTGKVRHGTEGRDQRPIHVRATAAAMSGRGRVTDFG